MSPRSITLPAFPGMWIPRKSDFYAVNCHGTEVVIAAARKRGVACFLDCSTQSRYFSGPSPSQDSAGEHSLLPPRKCRVSIRARKCSPSSSPAQAAASGFPLVIGTPTMPIGPHDHNLTPPTAMLRHFLSGHVQLYLDFIVNLVDVRDVCCRPDFWRWNMGELDIATFLAAKSIPLKKILQLMATISGRRYVFDFGSRPSGGTGRCNAGVHIRSRDAPSAVRDGRGRPNRVAGDGAVDRKGATRALDAPRPIEPALRDTIAAPSRPPRRISGVVDLSPNPLAFPVFARAPSNQDMILAMMHDQNQFLAFVWSGWTATWLTQSLALIWVAWLISWAWVVFFRPEPKSTSGPGTGGPIHPDFLRGHPAYALDVASSGKREP